MFHLTTHAFFKALLFLSAGAVIFACHHEQDIFKMGGLRKKTPITFVVFTIGVLAIIGMPGFAGFFSKDAILYLAYENNAAVFAILAFTAILTAFYMVRLWKLVFLGEPRSESAGHAHEAGAAMTIPLIVLAILSVVGGYVALYPKVFTQVFELIPEAQGSAHTTILFVSLAVLLVGAGSALLLYKSSGKDALAAKSPGLFGGLALLKSSPDEIYTYYVRKIQDRFALVLNFIDQVLLGGLIVRGLAGFVGLIGMGARALYVGSLHAYVYWFLIGAALVWGFAAGVF
jgi:NADH-quinone oxidoreductase subunit L